MNAVGLLDGLRTLDGLLIAVVPDRHVGSSFGESLGNGKTDAGSGSGHNGGAALEGEEGKDTFVLGGNGVVVGEVTPAHSRSCHSDRG